jgi:hypothetical protein
MLPAGLALSVVLMTMFLKEQAHLSTKGQRDKGSKFLRANVSIIPERGLMQNLPASIDYYFPEDCLTRAVLSNQMVDLGPAAIALRQTYVGHRQQECGEPGVRHGVVRGVAAAGVGLSQGGVGH